MFKQLSIAFIVAVIISTFAIAQENPDNDKTDVQNTTEIKTEQSSEDATELKEVEIWNKVCPVEGGPVEDDTATIEYNGKLYGFCCPGCDAEFAENPEKFAKNLNEAGTRFIGRK